MQIIELYQMNPGVYNQMKDLIDKLYEKKFKDMQELIKKRPYLFTTEYSDKWLELERPQPLSDNNLESVIRDVILGKMNPDISDKVYDDFKQECQNWIFNTQLNKLSGIEDFNRVDIINGCTQFITADIPIRQKKVVFEIHDINKM